MLQVFTRAERDGDLKLFMLTDLEALDLLFCLDSACRRRVELDLKQMGRAEIFRNGVNYGAWKLVDCYSLVVKE